MIFTMTLVIVDAFLCGIAVGLGSAFWIGHYYVQKEKREAKMRDRMELSQLALDAMNQRIIDELLGDDEEPSETRH